MEESELGWIKFVCWTREGWLLGRKRRGETAKGRGGREGETHNGGKDTLVGEGED